MIQASNEFMAAIKQSVRAVSAKVELLFSPILTLERQDIQEITIDSTAKKELGAIQKDLVSIKVLKGVIGEGQFNREIEAKIYIGVYIGEIVQYVCMGRFRSSYWELDDRTGTITIKFEGKINSNAIIADNVIRHGVSIKQYAGDVIQSIFGLPITIGNVLDVVLPSAYLYYDDVTKQLEQIAIACNGLFRYADGFELVPYKITTPLITLKQGENEAVISVKRLTDYSKRSVGLKVLKSFFSKSEVANLFSSGNIKLPPGAASYPVEMNLGYPCSVKYFSFKNYGYLQDYKPGITKSMMYLNNGYGDRERVVSVDVFGQKVVSTVVGEKNITDGSMTYIENPYIQLDGQIVGLDMRIYNGISYRIKYRGNPCIQIGDTVALEGIGNILVTSHNLSFSGGLSGILEGVCIA